MRVAIVGYENVWLKYIEVLENNYGFNIPIVILDDFNNKNHLCLKDRLYLNNMLLQKGVIPFEVSNSLNEEFLKELYNYDFFYQMLFDRMELSANRPKITTFEKQYIIYKLANFYDFIIKKNNLDFVYFSNIPHNLFDFIFYIVCKINNTNTLILRKDSFSTLYLEEDFFSDRKKDFESSLINFNKKEKIKFNTDDIKNYFNSLYNTNNYEEIKPDYMKKQEKEKNIGSVSYYIKIIFNKNLKTTFYYLFKKDSISNFKIRYNENFFSDEKSSKLKYFMLYLNNFYSKKILKKKYIQYSKKLDKNFLESKKYIYLALHYQPEATSLPTGGYFSNQIYIINLLKDNIPKDHYLIIKEHPSQLIGPNLGASGRWNKFYEIVSKSKNIIFSSIDTDQIELIKQSEAIATISGTIGLEALGYKKRVLVFGKTWYEELQGVFRIRNKKDLENFFHTKDEPNELSDLINECEEILEKSFINKTIIGKEPIRVGYLNAFKFYKDYLEKVDK